VNWTAQRTPAWAKTTVRDFFDRTASAKVTCQIAVSVSGYDGGQRYLRVESE
jgi:hypothetical protein